MMKKWIACLCAAVMLTGMVPLAAGAEDGTKTIGSAEEAEQFARDLLDGNGAAWDGKLRMIPAMEEALVPYGGLQGMGTVFAMQTGGAEQIGPAYEQKADPYVIYRVPCRFTAKPMDLLVTVQDGVLAGISFTDYTGKAEETEENAAFESVELAIPVPALNGVLPGTLTLPKGEGPFPAVILVHGSGPNNRDEAIQSLTPFRDIAEGLAEKGIAVYRYDKRTYVYGAQMAQDRGGTLMEETIEDAAAAVQLLAKQEKIDPERIFVAGHSLGGMAVPAIDRELRKAENKARGYILMAAPARGFDTLLREQYDFLYSLMPEVPEEAQAEKEQLFRELDRLNDPSSLKEDDVIAGVYAPYWIWMKNYDITGEAEEITAPCLLLQGEEDYQVTMEDFRLWKEAVGAKENWKLISYPGLVHVFVSGKKEEGAAVYSRTQKVDDRVIGDIAGFVDETK